MGCGLASQAQGGEGASNDQIILNETERTTSSSGRSGSSCDDQITHLSKPMPLTLVVKTITLHEAIASSAPTTLTERTTQTSVVTTGSSITEFPGPKQQWNVQQDLMAATKTTMNHVSTTIPTTRSTMTMGYPCQVGTTTTTHRGRVRVFSPITTPGRVFGTKTISPRAVEISVPTPLQEFAGIGGGGGGFGGGGGGGLGGGGGGGGLGGGGGGGLGGGGGGLGGGGGGLGGGGGGGGKGGGGGNERGDRSGDGGGTDSGKSPATTSPLPSTVTVASISTPIQTTATSLISYNAITTTVSGNSSMIASHGNSTWVGGTPLNVIVPAVMGSVSGIFLIFFCCFWVRRRRRANYLSKRGPSRKQLAALVDPWDVRPTPGRTSTFHDRQAPYSDWDAKIPPDLTQSTPTANAESMHVLPYTGVASTNGESPSLRLLKQRSLPPLPAPRNPKTREMQTHVNRTSSQRRTLPGVAFPVPLASRQSNDDNNNLVSQIVEEITSEIRAEIQRAVASRAETNRSSQWERGSDRSRRQTVSVQEMAPPEYQEY